jgi:hypothetical protein
MVYSVIEVVSGWKRQLDNIKILRGEYSDVLNAEDLKNIFDKHSLIQDQRRRLVIQTSIRAGLWLLTLIALFLLAYYGNKSLKIDIESPIYM